MFSKGAVYNGLEIMSKSHDRCINTAVCVTVAVQLK